METMEIGWSIWTTFQPFPWKCFVEIRLDNVHGNHGNRLDTEHGIMLNLLFL
jgi:hypothetical protein